MRKFGFLSILFSFPVISLASPLITLGSIAANNIAVFGYDSVHLSSQINISVDAASHYNVNGNVVGTSFFTQQGSLTISNGSEISSGIVLTNAETDLSCTGATCSTTGGPSVLTQLASLTYTPVTITSGTTNTFSSPGNYLLSTGTLGAGTIIKLTSAGPYVFEISGAMNWTSVTVQALNSGLSSDNVFWYDQGTGAVVSVTDSSVFGDIVERTDGGNDVYQAAQAFSGSLTGRLLSGAFGTSLTAVQGSTVNIVDQGTGISPAPEPSTFALFSLAMGAGLIVLRRRNR